MPSGSASAASRAPQLRRRLRMGCSQRRRDHLPEDRRKIAKAATMRVAIAFEEARAERDLAGEHRIDANGAADGVEPFLDASLLGGETIASPPPAAQAREEAQAEIAGDARAFEAHRQMEAIGEAAPPGPIFKCRTPSRRQPGGDLIHPGLEELG